MDDKIKDSSILIVDDTVDNLVFLEQVFLRKGYRNIRSINDSRNVLSAISEEEPDIILLDIMMPHFDGYEILHAIRSSLDVSVYLPIVVLTAITDRQARQKSLKDGATDFMTKPLDAIEVVQRVTNLLQTRYMYKEQVKYRTQLEAAVLQRTKELNQNNQALQKMNQVLDQTNVEIAEGLAEASEFRDDATGKHTMRVGTLAALIAAEMGLPPKTVALIRIAARLHDLGKIGIQDSILLKPDKLTNEEFEEMKKHCEIGAQILSRGNSALLRMAEKIALSHHERWDGRGYPHGLTGEEIPLEARIVAVADIYDALTHVRPYKTAWSKEDAIKYIEQQKDKQFDANVVDAFFSATVQKQYKIHSDELQLESSLV